MAVGDAFLPSPNEQRALAPVAPVIPGAPVPDPNAVPTSRLGDFFANRPTENLQLASILGKLAGAVGGPAGNIGGAFGEIAQQGIAGKNVSNLAQQNQQPTQLTPEGEIGDTEETITRKADGTIVRTTKGNERAAGTPQVGATSQTTGSAFAPQVQAPFNQPTQDPITLEGLSGLPVAVQLQLLDRQRQGEAQQAERQQAQAAGQLAQQKQDFAQTQNPVRETIAGRDGQFYHVHNDGTMTASGIKVPQKLQAVTIPTGPGGEKSAVPFDPNRGTVGAAFGVGTPAPTGGGNAEKDRADAVIKLQKEVRDSSVTKNEKGETIPRVVSSRDVQAFNKVAELNNLPYRHTKVKINFDIKGRGDYRGDYLFTTTEADGVPTDQEMIDQMVADYDVPRDRAERTVDGMAAEQEGK